MERDISTIHNQLHGNSINIISYGTNHERLMLCADTALRNGLTVWLQPRFQNISKEEYTKKIVEFARKAELLNKQYSNVKLNMGCELYLFLNGIVPGNDTMERIDAIIEAGDEIFVSISSQINSLFRTTVPLVRKNFTGEILYSYGTGETINWDIFDYIGCNKYLDAESEATYADDLAVLCENGKPVIITEFGSCSYSKAYQYGGMAWDVIDWDQTPPRFIELLIRDEQLQADVIDESIDIFVKEKMAGCFVYEFLTPGMPHTDDPWTDLDMAGYGLVKVASETLNGNENRF